MVHGLERGRFVVLRLQAERGGGDGDWLAEVKEPPEEALADYPSTRSASTGRIRTHLSVGAREAASPIAVTTPAAAASM